MIAAALSLLLAAAVAGAPEPLPAAQMGTGPLTERLSARPLGRVEGVWQFPDGGAVVSIERAPGQDGGERLIMAVVSAPDRMLIPGTVIGTVTPTSKPDIFAAQLFTSVESPSGKPSAPKMFTLALTCGDSRLELRHHRKGLKLNWWKLLPYMFRGAVTQIDETPRDLDGCIRIFPAPALREHPRYL